MQDFKLFLGNAPDYASHKPTDVGDILEGLGLPRPVHLILRKGTGDRRDATFCIAEFASANDANYVLATCLRWPSGLPMVVKLL